MGKLGQWAVLGSYLVGVGGEDGLRARIRRLRRGKHRAVMVAEAYLSKLAGRHRILEVIAEELTEMGKDAPYLLVSGSTQFLAQLAPPPPAGLCWVDCALSLLVGRWLPCSYAPRQLPRTIVASVCQLQATLLLRPGLPPTCRL